MIDVNARSRRDPHPWHPLLSPSYRVGRLGKHTGQPWTFQPGWRTGRNTIGPYSGDGGDGGDSG
jgi:hypothetical protein